MRWMILLLSVLLGGCMGISGRADRTSLPRPDAKVEKRAGLETELPAGRVVYDLYLPAGRGQVPLVVVAHGFARSRHNMKYWGERLAAEGFVVAIPTAPRWMEPQTNADAMAQLAAYIVAFEPRVDAKRIGLVGFSAGGYQTLLAAGRIHAKVWVGLDPVITGEMTAESAKAIESRAYVLRAEPGLANLHGNFRLVQDELPQLRLRFVVRQSVHIDPEWPTDGLAELALGRVDAKRREVYIQYTVAALRWELLEDPQAHARLAGAAQDPQVRCVRVALPAVEQANPPH